MAVMTPRSSQPPSDNDSLQADVMRFMAIIAFCLIAILALVKEVEPARKQAPAAKPEVVQAPVQKKPAVVMTESAQPVPESSRPQQEDVRPLESWREPLQKPVEDVGQTAPTRKPSVKKRTPISAAVGDTMTASVSQPEAAAQPSADTAATETAPEEEEGLSLRFASDGDFLRLIARGEIKVYAFNGTDVLGLNNAYEFLNTRTPGKVYELLPQTIPSLIFDSLTRSRRQQGDSDGYNWGITLPGSIESQITNYLATATSGALVIDKYGEVHHVAHN